MLMDNCSETHVRGYHFEGSQIAAVRLINANTSTKFTGKGFINLTNAAFNGAGFIIENAPGNSAITIENCKLLNNAVLTAVTFTAPLVAAISGTLTVSWAGSTGSYTLVFSEGSVRTLITLTNGSTAVSWPVAVTATAAASAISKSGSIAIDMQGAAANDAYISNNEIQGWDIAINDNGTTGTTVKDNSLYGNRLGIVANSGATQYSRNNIHTTLGAWAIDHIGFGGAATGIWTNNLLDKPIKPTQTGVNGNFANNQVYGNKGFKTSGMYVTGSVSSPAVIAHGMAGTPQFVQLALYSGAPTNMIVSALDATNITVSWGGGGLCQISVRATLLCENQL